jgi:hypothetical protein
LPSADTIPSYKPTPTQDFNYLREKGLQYIQQLSGALWTDHNLHDPGITILEVLCYALIDLGYRTNFDVKDLVATEDGKTPDNTFHTAREIFTTRPVSIRDYRKLLMDIPGVRNAWLFAQDATGKPYEEGISLYAYCKESRLLYEKDIETINANDRPHVRQEEKIIINGLYTVKLELDEHPLYGDLNSSTVQLKGISGALAGYHLELFFPFWNKQDARDRELLSFFKAEKIDEISAVVVNDTRLDAAKFAEVKRNKFAVRFTVKYGTEERVIDKVAVTIIKTPPAANGLVKAGTLQAGLSDRENAGAREVIKRYRQRPTEIFKVFDKVRATLHQHRNLCEDFIHNIGFIDTEELTLCMDIDVQSNADLETIQGKIFALVENYLLPPVQFSTLPQLLQEGVPVEEIFNGPALQHGFLTDEAIDKSDIKQEYYTSDIVGKIMDIEGVRNVRNFQFTVYANDGAKRIQRDDWRITVTPNHKLKLKREGCKLLFYKNGLPMNARFIESISKLQLTNVLQNHLKYKSPENDLSVPKGKYRNLGKHYSILNEFPRLYGLGEKDLPDTVPAERKAQVKQLEAYLIFFDQLLANYFGQLNSVKDLLSFKQDGLSTYTSQYFYSDKDAKQLFENADFLQNKIDDTVLQQMGEANTIINQSKRSFLKIQTGLQSITETYSQYLDRRNRLLDHLISRFAESFNEYAINMYALPDEMVLSDDAAAEKLINDKINLLRNYPAISSGRSGAFNYALKDVDGENPLTTNNLSGYARRMRSLLGMDTDRTRPISTMEPKDDGGFHLVEHLLLRPVAVDNALLSVCLQENCDHCGEEDPYSFRASIILPYWPLRFKNMNFRNYMESLFRSEAPAHVFLKICWVDEKEMTLFEEAYSSWIIAKATYTQALPTPNETIQNTYNDALKKLIETMEGLRTDFPATTLHDCTDRNEENDTRVFLGHTALGTYLNITEDDPK